MGNVAAGYYISAGSGVIIEGNACAPALGIGAGVRVDGITHCSAPTLQADILSASTQLATMLAQPTFDITTSQTLRAGVYQIGALTLNNSDSLTLHGNANDSVVINVTGPAKLGSGTSIKLTGGLKPSNVYFNFISTTQFRSFEFGGATLLGNYISDGRSFIMGDGATLDNTRFLTNGDVVANIQTIRYDTTSITPLPDDESNLVGSVSSPALGVIAFSVLLLGWARAKRSTQK